MELEALPGVGPRLALRLRRRFGSDAAFWSAAESLDIQAISAVDGVSEQRAVELVRAVRGDDGGDRFLATPSARRVHKEILDRLLSYAATPHGRNRLRLLAFQPDPDAAAAHMEAVMAAKAAVRGLDQARIRSLLRRLRPLSDPTPRPDPARLVVCEDDDVEDTLRGAGVTRWAHTGGPRDLQDARDYDLVVVAYREGHLDASGLENVVEVPVDPDPWAVCPERTLALFSSHRDVLEALAALAEAFGRQTVASEALDALDAASPEALDPDAVRAAVDAERAALDTRLQERVAGLSLSGAELLAAVGQGGVPAALRAVLDEEVTRSRRVLRAATGLDIQPYVAGLPVRLDEEELDRVLEALRAQGRVAAFQQAQRAARALGRLTASLRQEVQDWLDQDARFALGCFAYEHDLHPAIFGEGLAFTDSIHLDLARDGSAQRIAYRLGRDENVAVLTGANSGGKSTLLQHLCQLGVMARMGLPVVGRDVVVPWLDEVHLVTARRGMDAGAFETFLRSFLPVVEGDARRLVLVDEVEAVTELEAAGRILAFVLDRLAATDSLAVVVTHLAPQVLQHVRTARVRVDGIQASGLDAEHRLVVDRTPRMGTFARSTPELIVQRLAATTRGREKALYEALLSAFAEPPQGQG